MENDIISAIRKGYFQQVRILIKTGSDVNVRDAERRTPLIYCALVDDELWGVGLARSLLENGASAALTDRLGLGPLHYAAIRQRPTLLRVYLSAADFNVNRRDRIGNTALHYAALTGNAAALDGLLEACVRYGYPMDTVNVDGVSPMGIAEDSGNAESAIRIAEAEMALRVKLTSIAAAATNKKPEATGEDLNTKKSIPIPTIMPRSRSRSRSKSSTVRREERRRKTGIVENDAIAFTSSGQLIRTAALSTPEVAGNIPEVLRSAPDGVKSAPEVTSSTPEVTKSTITIIKTCNGRSTLSSASGSGSSDGKKTPRLKSAKTTAPWKTETADHVPTLESVFRTIRNSRPISAASARDPRSNPENILRRKPSDIFLTSGRDENDAVEIDRQVAPLVFPEERTTNRNWKSNMRNLYDTFYYQFSLTYRPLAKPPPPPFRNHAGSDVIGSEVHRPTSSSDVVGSDVVRPLRPSVVRRPSAYRRPSQVLRCSVVIEEPTSMAGSGSGSGSVRQRRRSSNIHPPRLRRRQSQHATAIVATSSAANAT